MSQTSNKGMNTTQMALYGIAALIILFAAYKFYKKKKKKKSPFILLRAILQEGLFFLFQVTRLLLKHEDSKEDFF